MMLSRLTTHFIAGYWDSWRKFPKPCLHRVEAAIARAEKSTSGEIKIAIEGALHPLQLMRGITPHQRALDVFSLLRVWDTEQNNGVLIYILLGDNAVEIIADRGIHGKAGGEPTWQRIVNPMQQAFAKGDYEIGLTAGIAAIAKELAHQYPALGDKQNRISDDIRFL